MKSLLSKATAGRRFIEDVKVKGLRRTLSDTGAVDLASIMVGVLVIGIIGGVIAATVFAVIPWSQDQAASQNLDAVKTAESVAYAQTTAGGTGRYLSLSELTDGVPVGPGVTEAIKPLLQKSSSVNVAAAGGKWFAVSASSTGKLFLSTSDDPSNPVSYSDISALNADVATALTAVVPATTVVFAVDASHAVTVTVTP